MKTHIYFWQGVDGAGMRAQGSMNAKNATAVKHDLETKQNIVPLRVYKGRNKKISVNHITDFSRQLSTMINSGVPLIAALNIIEHSYEHAGMQRLIMTIKQDVESGLSLHKAFKNHARHFDDLFCNLVYAGEQSGTLDKMLSHIADYKEKVAVLKRKVKKAMFYPIVVLLMAAIVTSVLLIFVVPQFAQLFSSFGAALPIYTQFIIKLSNFIKVNWPYMTLGIFAVIVGFKSLHKYSRPFVLLLDKLILTIPIFGKVLQQAIIARFARTLAITFAAGLPLSEALAIMAGIAGNYTYEKTILAMQENVVAGQTIANAMEQSSLFPNRMIQMIHIGEESGALDVMLVKISEYYEAEVNHVIDNLTNLLEPMIMAILGILIGGLIVGMYLPIFQLGTVI